MEVASRAQQLLEHSLLSELHAVVARALSGLDMFAGHQLSEADLYGAEAAEARADELKVQAISPQLYQSTITLFTESAAAASEL